jgi:hypothetical protein
MVENDRKQVNIAQIRNKGYTIGYFKKKKREVVYLDLTLAGKRNTLID